MKPNEIKKHLENNVNGSDHFEITDEELLAVINQLEAENKRLTTLNHILETDKNSLESLNSTLYNRCDLLEVKVERLEKHELREAVMFNSGTVKRCVNEAVKEYKSKVENDIITLLGKSNCDDFIECLEYRYKEMVGDVE